MRSKTLVLLLSLTAATPAMAGRWVTIADGSTRAVHLDTAGIQREGTQTRAWVREVHTQEQRSDQAGVLYYSTNTLTNYDCAQRTFAPLFRVFYGSDAMELRRIKLDAVEVPALVLPGSINEQLLDKACEAADNQAKARNKPASASQAAAKPAATGAAAAANPAEDKSAAAKPAEAKPQAKAGEAAADATPNEDQKKEVQAAAPSRAADKPAEAKPAHAAQADHKTAEHAPAGAHDKAAPAGPARKPSALAALTGGAHGGSVQVSSVALARARAHGYVMPVNTAPSRPAKAKAKVKPKPEPAAHDKAEHAEVHWGYTGAGAPENWAKLDPDYALCSAGKRQSPIDIREGARLDLEPIQFDYRPSPLRIIDNGHTVQVNYAEGSTITVAGERFELKQFHFHKPAEERIDGRWFDMVAHLVHESMDGRLAVVAVLFEMRDQPNAFLRTVWPHLPLEAGREVRMHDVMIDANALLPETRTYFTYMGSLTTPPCSEGVRWIVLKTPVEVSFNQVAVFSKLYSMNARPIQPSFGRLIKESN